jgi:hypothetical protein
VATASDHQQRRHSPRAGLILAIAIPLIGLPLAACERSTIKPGFVEAVEAGKLPKVLGLVERRRRVAEASCLTKEGFGDVVIPTNELRTFEGPDSDVGYAVSTGAWAAQKAVRVADIAPQLPANIGKYPADVLGKAVAACSESSQVKKWAVVANKLNDYRGRMLMAEEEFKKTSSYSEATKAWSRCLASQGYRFASRSQIVHQLQSQLAARPDDGIPAMTSPSPLQAKEVAIARADLKCSGLLENARKQGNQTVSRSFRRLGKDDAVWTKLVSDPEFASILKEK